MPDTEHGEWTGVLCLSQVTANVAHDGWSVLNLLQRLDSL